ncbi:KGGVGR-motif variant AAA ATPase [Flagellimonas sp. 2504JD4-2]
MGNIITFYSYKGGVGRSMALANISYLLSSKNKKVLMVDWDLEAPGLERYFDFDEFSVKKSNSGLLQYLDKLKSGNASEKDYLEYCWQIDLGFSSNLFLMSSGRDNDPPAYSKLLEGFNWDSFFTQGKGGYHLDLLRDVWKEDFDYVLIDSRTGLSDSSGICTIFMPDILVPMFTANYQSLFGINDTVEFVNAARQKLQVDRMALTTLPIPSRFGTRIEFQQSQEWLDRIDNILSHLMSDWLPKWVESRHIFEQIKIPQVDYFSFGEKLAVFEQGTSDPEGMGFVYAKIADLIASDFQDIASFAGKEYYEQRREVFERSKPDISKKTSQISYDVYVSYSRSDYEWVNEAFLPTFRDYLGEHLGRSPRIYMDINELDFFQDWAKSLQSGIRNSKSFVFIIGNTFGQFQQQELQNLMKFQSEGNERTVFPVLLQDRKEEGVPWHLLPQELSNIQALVLNKSKSLHTKNTRNIVDFGRKVDDFSKHVAQSIEQSQMVNNIENPNTLLSNIDGQLHELKLMAREYELLRINMTGGPQRTQQMERIVSRMKSISDNASGHIKELQQSENPGDRLAAIAIMQVNPDMEHSNWLKEHVGDAEQPFIGYQACVALFIITRSFSKKHSPKLFSVLSDAKSQVENSTKKDAGQLRVLDASLHLVDNQNLPMA